MSNVNNDKNKAGENDEEVMTLPKEERVEEMVFFMDNNEGKRMFFKLVEFERGKKKGETKEGKGSSLQSMSERAL